MPLYADNETKTLSYFWGTVSRNLNDEQERVKACSRQRDEGMRTLEVGTQGNLGFAEQAPCGCAPCPRRCVCWARPGSGLITRASGRCGEGLVHFVPWVCTKRLERAGSTLDGHSGCVTGHCSRCPGVIFQRSRHCPLPPHPCWILNWNLALFSS